MNLFQILADVNSLCSDALIQAVIGTVKNVLTVISIAVPIVLIVLCTIDMFRAFTNGDDKERSKAWKGAIKRLVFAVIVFIVPWLVKLGFSLLGRLIDTNGEVNGFETFLVCWDSTVGTGGSNNQVQAPDGYCDCPNFGIRTTKEASCDTRNGCTWTRK